MAYDEKFFAEATSAELKSFRSTLNMDEVSADQVAALDDLIVERTVNEKVQAALQQNEAKTRSKTLDEKAKKMWPELKDEKTDFYAAVNEYMEQNGADNPDSLLNAANAVGLEMGLQPAGREPVRTDPMKNIKGAKPTGSSVGEKGEEFLKKTEKVAKAFGNLIDMNDEKVRERVAQRAEENSDG